MKSSSTRRNMTFLDRIDPQLLPGLSDMEAVRAPTAAGHLEPFRRAYSQLLSERVQGTAVKRSVGREDHWVPRGGGGPPLLLRRYAPADLTGPGRAIYWIHGGGMIVGSVEGDDPYCETLADATQSVVLSIDYRLAPEHTHTDLVEDAYAGFVWAARRPGLLNIDPDRFAVAGASAGGGLAAGVALLSRDRQGPKVALQYLMYPMLDDRSMTPSSREFSGIPSWNRENNEFAWRCLLGDLRGSDDVSPYAAPARMSDLSGLPPTLIQVGELDTFRDEDIGYATRLMQAGVRTELHVYPGAYHGWDAYNPGAQLTARAMRDRNEAIARTLDLGPAARSCS
jgi:acetyl esterase/lipase